MTSADVFTEFQESGKPCVLSSSSRSTSKVGEMVKWAKRCEIELPAAESVQVDLHRRNAARSARQRKTKVNMHPVGVVLLPNLAKDISRVGIVVFAEPL